MSKFIPAAALSLATAGMLAATVPAQAAPSFDTSPVAAAAHVDGANQWRGRDRDWRDRRDYDRGYGNRDYGRSYQGNSWRGRDGRYYCRRNNGTTGLLIGGAAGGLIGNGVAGRGDRTLGTILGVAGGALLGREIDRGGSRGNCR